MKIRFKIVLQVLTEARNAHALSVHGFVGMVVFHVYNSSNLDVSDTLPKSGTPGCVQCVFLVRLLIL